MTTPNFPSEEINHHTVNEHILLDLMSRIATTVDFQNKQSGQNLSPKYTVGNVSLESPSMIVGAFSKPWNVPGLPAGIPDKIHFLRAMGGHLFVIRFAMPVKWVSVTVAPGWSGIDPDTTLCVYFSGLHGDSMRQEVVNGPYNFKTVYFSWKDLIKHGGGDFEPPVSFTEAGSISTINIWSSYEMLLWKLSYWYPVENS